MNVLVYSLLLILNVLNVVLHTVGTYALLVLYRNTQDRPQRLLLINHSFCESVRHFLDVIIVILHLVSLPQQHVLTYIRFFLEMIAETGICVVEYLAMVYITLNKLFEILLNVKYRDYWNERKTKTLVLSTWCVGLLICVLSTATSILTSYDIDVIFHQLVYPLCDFVFIAVALVTLISILQKYNKRRRKLLLQKYVHNKKRLDSATFRMFVGRGMQAKRNFAVPVVLIVIFLVLLIVPDMTYFLVGVVNKSKQSDLLVTCILILNAIASQIDACVYLFFLPDVRKLLNRRLIQVPCGNCLCFYTRDEGEGVEMCSLHGDVQTTRL